MNEYSRRNFGKQTVSSLLMFSFLETVARHDLFADEIQPVTAPWLAQLHQLGMDLKGEKLTPVQWQQMVEQLMARVSLPDLVKFIDLDKVVQQAKLKSRGETSMRARFPEVDGLPTKLVFGHQIFALTKGRSVVPHGHNNMATAFLILDGEFHGRHYDRLEDEDQHMIIRPTIDRQFGRAEYSTVSDDKDNVHWFQTTSDTGYIFNIHILSVQPGRTGRVYIDPHGNRQSDGRIRARIIKTEEAYQRFG